MEVRRFWEFADLWRILDVFEAPALAHGAFGRNGVGCQMEFWPGCGRSVNRVSAQINASIEKVWNVA